MNSENLSALWPEVLRQLETSGNYDAETFSAWISKISLYSIDDDVVYVTCPSMITLNILKQGQDKSLLENTISRVLGRTVSVVLQDAKHAPAKAPAIKLQKNAFNPDYTFDSFVEGSSNREAFAACYSACMQTGLHMFNPIMIYGNSGLGKTHLLHAVGNLLTSMRPETKVIYMYAGAFVDLLIDAMKNKRVDEVKAQLTNCDYFLLDDIQNLRNSSSQEIFFSVYNELISKNTQIIITSDMHPSELSGLQSRLISRFTSGLAVNIVRPEFDTSRAILRKRIEGKEEAICIQDDVIDYLAQTFSNDVRNLEGSLNRLIFSATLENPEVIDLAFAKKVLVNEPIVDQQQDLSAKQIKKAVIRFYGLSYSDLEGKSRQKAIVNARHICVFLCREMLHLSYASIGQELGGRDHTTITSSYERACTLKKKDDAFAQAIRKIRQTLEKSA